MKSVLLSSVIVRIFIFIPIIIFPLTVKGVGFLQLRNFTHENYKGGPQNWAFAQDSVGRIYIGNRDGMLCFDGERWNKFPLPNYSTVRSLLYVPDEGRIYASGTDEFGYFESKEDTGLLNYVSLRETLPKSSPSFTEVWHIHRLGKRIYFQTDNHLLSYDGRSTTVIKSPGRISTSSLIDGTIVVGLQDGRILQLSSGTLVPLPGTEPLLGSRIQALLPGLGKFLIATSIDGLFVYTNRQILPIDDEISNFLKENQLFCGASQGNIFIFGTVTRGAVIKDFTAGTTRYVNKESGMLNNTVLNAAFDTWGNIWLGLDNGLDYVFFNSPVTTLVGPGTEVGAGYSSLIKEDRLFMGTNQGLYSTSYPFKISPSQISLTKELQGQVWSITDNGNGFFVSGDGGIFANDGRGFYRIEGLGGGYGVRLITGKPKSAIASSYDGFHILERKNGIWKSKAVIAGDKDIRGGFVIDKHNNVWINNWLQGLYRLHLDTVTNRFDKVKLYNSEEYFPRIYNNSIVEYKGELVISTEKGFFTWSSSKDSFVLHPQLNSILKPGKSATIHGTSPDALALLDRKGLHLSIVDSSGNRHSVSMPLRGYRDRLVNGFEHVNILSPSEVLLGTQYGFWLVDPTVKSEKGGRTIPFVNSVVANLDSIVYRAPLDPTKSKLKLSYGLHSLKFEIGYPDFVAPNEISFSTFLQGYDKEWSSYSQEASREYTGLREGAYTLHIRARNHNNEIIEESKFNFRISPPWYRTVVAKVFYGLLFLGMVVVSIKLIRRWKLRAEQEVEREKEEELQKLRRQAEQEALKKDYEIASLKSEQLEIDIKHKSGELSTAAMNLIRKNEILTALGSKISKIQTSEKLDSGVKRQLEQLQSQIRDNISHDDIWTDFNRNFDIVHQNYIQRLRKRYPQLTSADIRLCCYIKMGLTSKDIAPLLNITAKSVEMARYRLRKKMDLPPESSLTSYLTNF